MKVVKKIKNWTPGNLSNEKGIVLPVGLILLVLVALTGGAAFKTTNT